MTNRPDSLANGIRQIANDNEVLIWMKDPDDAPRDPSLFIEAGEHLPVVVGVPAPAPGQSASTSLRPTDASKASIESVLGLLETFGIRPYRDRLVLPFWAVRIPDAVLNSALSALLTHPSVAYIEANQRRPIFFDAAPVGTNPTTSNHDMHQVQEAWDFTRGDGVQIGVLDSGLAYDQNAASFHPDAQYFSTYGVYAKGFSDDYKDCGVNGGHQAGNCKSWDDHGHGTRMVGLVGANDNSMNYVGVAPFATTYSMKVTHNSDVTGNTCFANYWKNVQYCIEEDDLAVALDWAAANGLEVASMSFSSDFGSTVSDAAGSAYYTYDVLLLSSAGNSSNPSYVDEPQEWAYVMSIGAVLLDGTSVEKDDYEEVSGYTGGGTLGRNCPDSTYCTPAGGFAYGDGDGGTSAATANVAGIAGLIHAYYPEWSAPQVRDRLITTAAGVNKVADAHAAIVGKPLNAVITGPALVPEYNTCEWSGTSSTGGTEPYTYAWYRDGQLVGNSNTYVGDVQTSDFTLEFRIADRYNNTSSDYHFVDVSSSVQEAEGCGA